MTREQTLKTSLPYFLACLKEFLETMTGSKCLQQATVSNWNPKFSKISQI